MTMSSSCDLLITNVHVATMAVSGVPYGAIYNADIAIAEGKIVDVGPMVQSLWQGAHTLNGAGCWVTPGLIDCHTHLVYGGDRAREFEMRLNGASYESIARQGGGILSTVQATRAASETELLTSATGRVQRLMAEGVTTVEIKSGYGLDRDTELKMLRVAKQLEAQLGLHVESTFLGAHALPAEFAGRPDDYIAFVCGDVLPEVAAAQWASSVDIFCEHIGFSTRHAARLFAAALRYGLAVKAHVEQLSDLKGAVTAAKYGALSVDHIEYLQAEDIAAIKSAGSVAVLLPGAFYYLNETQKPPVQALREQGVDLAVATDHNPGSSPLLSLLTALNMACVLFGLSPEEALLGATRNAAKALGLARKGQIAPGFDADLCLWPMEHPSELSYAINQHRPVAVLIGGELVGQ